MEEVEGSEEPEKRPKTEGEAIDATVDEAEDSRRGHERDCRRGHRRGSRRDRRRTCVTEGGGDVAQHVVKGHHHSMIHQSVAVVRNNVLETFQVHSWHLTA